MSKQKFTIKEISSKSILQKSGLPDVDWVINPYGGCRFGCKYCYAAFVGKFRHPDEEWGNYVDIKTNAPELLKAELTKKLKKSSDIGTIFLSSVTDPYQGLEAKYQLTKKCLQVLLDFNYQGKVSILTKSTLVTRDIQLFKQFHNIEVGLTITSTGDPIAEYLETYAAPHQSRLTALAELSQAGISTYTFVGPLLPHFVWQEGQMKKLLQAIKAAGAKYVYVEHLNLTPTIKKRLFEFLEKDHPELLEKFTQSTQPEYRDKLDKIIHQLLKELQLPLAHEQVLYHRNLKKS
ncbi:MAG: radical SAM protein [Candidatus Pacebacteria bacterium]|jgi:DNA repair photolyase|nr:radical SAM protein [Candidatus Paceibacterota bacterium]MBT3512281.1 radical SAM protein [Candidatus Paceibacterota bacterium]MBT4004525.1 radical SAM protein [Candidatus Paceibacterota bacterium]MBT4358857.1 radical SAM protein [Candidatus Paceibacterota bacterium]MBT4681194.1 radical SAM protein [Candidatus Paceibacterota bacterium]